MQVKLKNRFKLSQYVLKRKTDKYRQSEYYIEQYSSMPSIIKETKENHEKRFKDFLDIDPLICIVNFSNDELFESIEIFKDTLFIGKFIENNLNDLFIDVTDDTTFRLPFFTIVDDYFVDAMEYIDKVFEVNQKEFENHIINFFSKYGILSSFYFDMEEDRNYNINNFLIMSHYLYQLFLIANYLMGKTNIQLKIYEFSDYDEQELKKILEIAVTKLERNYETSIKYNSEIDSFTTETIFPELTQVSSYEFINTLISKDSGYNSSFLTICSNCNKIFESTNKNKKYCDSYECNLARNRERKKRSDLNKKKGDK